MEGSKKFMLYLFYDAIKSQLLIFFEHTLLVRYIMKCVEYNEPFYKALIAVGIIFGLYAISFIPDGLFYHKLELKEKPKIVKCFNDKLYQKATQVDLICYDNSKYYNDLILSISESERIIDRFITFLSQFIKCCMVFLTTGIFYLTVDGVGLFFLVFSFIFNVIVGNMINKLNYDVRMGLIPHEKKQKYVGRLFYLNKYAKEVRTYSGMADSFVEAYHTSNAIMIDLQKKVGTKRMMLDFVQKYLLSSFITNVIYIIYLLYRIIIFKTIDYSDAIVLFNRVGEIRRATRDMSNVISMFKENDMYIERIKEFLFIESSIISNAEKEPICKATAIEFKDVSFGYSQGDELILNKLNFCVNKGEKVAIVGHNGAGKSTLIKLLLRLYDPLDGEILLGGTDIKNFDVAEYRKKFGVIFQDFQIYAASVIENVMLDEVKHCEEEIKRVEKALNDSGFGNKLKEMKKNLDTEITQEFDNDGINLSGGESQMIATARTFVSNGDILIMDEPSSALDPIAEYSLYKVMERMSTNKTVFYISHRLSTTRDADRILVMDQGDIVEEGNHEELLKLNGIYARMWNVQSRRYGLLNSNG